MMACELGGSFHTSLYNVSHNVVGRVLAHRAGGRGLSVTSSRHMGDIDSLLTHQPISVNLLSWLCLCDYSRLSA